ncbi:hypothetical protein JCM19992_26130 [Thermostilla marina]
MIDIAWIGYLSVLAWPAVLLAAGFPLVAYFHRDDELPPSLSLSFLAGAGLFVLAGYVVLASAGRITPVAWWCLLAAISAAGCYGVARLAAHAGAYRLQIARTWKTSPAACVLLAGLAGLMFASAAHLDLEGYDAKAIYGLKAKLLAAGESVEGEYFSDIYAAHFQARYPFAVSLLEAPVFFLRNQLPPHTWSDTGLPLLFAAFALATTGLIGRTVARWGERFGLWWSIAFLATPIVHGITEGAGLSGSADLPMASFLTAGLLLAWESSTDARLLPTTSVVGRWLLVGVFLGTAPLTKQDAVLWLGASIVAAAVAFVWSHRARPVRMTKHLFKAAIPGGTCLFLVGTAIVLSLVVHAGMGRSPYYRSYGKTLDPTWLMMLGNRPFQVLRFAASDWVHLAWGCYWPVATAVFLMGRKVRASSATRVLQTIWWMVAVAILLIFTVTPYQIDYHLHTAFRRLWAHLYPLACVLTAEHLHATGWIAYLAGSLKQYANARYVRARQGNPTGSIVECRSDRTAA